MLAAIAAGLWIVLDVGMTLLTSPKIPLWQWCAVVYGGSAVVLFTFISGIYEHLHTRKEDRNRSGEMTGLKERLIKQEGMLAGMGVSLSQTREVLASESNARPADTALKATLAEVESKL